VSRIAAVKDAVAEAPHTRSNPSAGKPAAPNGLVQIELLIGVDHDATASAGDSLRRGDPPDVVIERIAAYFDLDGRETFLEGVTQRLLELRKITIVA
jgi:hypothetical protein